MGKKNAFSKMLLCRELISRFLNPASFHSATSPPPIVEHVEEHHKDFGMTKFIGRLTSNDGENSHKIPLLFFGDLPFESFKRWNAL